MGQRRDTTRFLPTWCPSISSCRANSSGCSAVPPPSQNTPSLPLLRLLRWVEDAHRALFSQVLSVGTIANLNKLFLPEDSSWRGHKHNVWHVPQCVTFYGTELWPPHTVAFAPEPPCGLSCFDWRPPGPSPPGHPAPLAAIEGMKGCLSFHLLLRRPLWHFHKGKSQKKKGFWHKLQRAGWMSSQRQGIPSSQPL